MRMWTCQKISNFTTRRTIRKITKIIRFSNCKVLVKMKDECNEVAPIEFVGLRAKMYSLLLPNEREKSTAKGIKKSYALKHVRHCAYRDCYLNLKTTSASFFSIRSVN